MLNVPLLLAGVGVFLGSSGGSARLRWHTSHYRFLFSCAVTGVRFQRVQFPPGNGRSSR